MLQLGLFALDCAVNVLVLFFSSTSESFLHAEGSIVIGGSEFTLLAQLNDPRGKKASSPPLVHCEIPTEGLVQVGSSASLWRPRVARRLHRPHGAIWWE